MTEDGPSAPRPTNDNLPVRGEFALAEDLLMALRFYSRLPTGSAPHLRPSLARIAPVLPLASLIIGLPSAILLLLLEWVSTPHLFAAVLAIGLGVIVTGAMAEDAVADAADGLFGGQSVDQRLDIMKDSRHGTYGVCAIVLLLGVRISAIGILANPLEAAGLLLTAPIIARSGALWLTMALPPARSGGAAASAGQVTQRNFVIGVAITLVLSFVLAGFAVGLLGLAAAYALGALTIWGWVTLCRRMIGGQTGDLIGALQALLEIAALTAFMIFV